MKHNELLYLLAERFAREDNKAFDTLPNWIKKGNISRQRKHAERAIQFGYEMFGKGFVAASNRMGIDPYEHVHHYAKLAGLVPEKEDE